MSPANGIAVPVAAAGSELAPADVDGVLTVLREHLVALCAQTTRSPSTIRLSVGAVALEVGWAPAAVGGTAYAVPAPAPGAGPVPVPVPAGVAGLAAVGAAPAPSGTAAPAATDAAEPGTFPLESSTIGVFYRSPEPGAPPFVVEGDTVAAGQQVAIVEAMKLMIPVEAERAGRVVRVLADDASPVEHGQPLFLFAPPGAAPGLVSPAAGAAGPNGDRPGRSA